MKKLSLTVNGMHCKSCEILIKDVLEETPGVKEAIVSEKSKNVKVEYDESKINEKKIKELIKKEGYEV